MHRFRTRRSTHRLWFGSAWLLMFLFGTVLLIAALAYGLMTMEKIWFYGALALLGFIALTGIAYAILAMDTRCPLCHGKLLLSQGCSHSSKARRLFGSYRLRVAVAVLTGRPFRCPYCGEVCECAHNEFDR